jgi:hypothetical protein
MRRTLGIFLFLGFVGTLIGCFTTGKQQPESGSNSGPPTGDKEHTLEYWGKVREALRLTYGPNDNLSQVASVVRRQAETLRQLSIDGVDHELYVAANALAQHQEKLLKTAEDAGYNPITLRSDPVLQKIYLRESQQIITAEESVKALRDKLSSRYGVAFPAIDNPK